VAKLYQDLFPIYLDPSAVKVVCGPSSVCDTILDCRFDFIFYTGSPGIGRQVQAKAARFLTPVLLELGGKSPVYVDRNCSLTTICRRLSYGKFFNGGQTCVCPDYVLVHEEIYDHFKEEMQRVIHEQFGDCASVNEDLCHIINGRHFDRIVKLIETSGGNKLIEGYRDREHLYIGPTLIESPSLTSELMQEEIFGPVLPFVKVSGPEEAIRFINEREKPLALYVLSSSSTVLDLFVKKTSSGCVMGNEAILHCCSQYMPFGGIGNSGMGQYRGKAGFKTLSHAKPVLTHSTLVDIPPRYAPYRNGWLPVLKRII
jgi:acyl-CoA reductase-like NAD-dependent aldehyde dehydrogenase